MHTSEMEDQKELNKSRKSYISSPNNEKPMYLTILDLFNQRVKETPVKEALVHRRINGERRSITYQELQKNAEKLARYLIFKGVRKGDRVALSGLNTIEWVVAEFAIFMTGAVLVNIGFTVTDQMTVMNVLKKTQCKTLIFDVWGRGKYINIISNLFEDFEEYRSSVNSLEKHTTNLNIVLIRESDRFCHPNLQEIMKMDLPDVELPVIYPEDSVAIFSTSGSVGQAKLFEHTHFTLANVIITRCSVPYKFYDQKFFGSPGGSPEGFICRGQTRVFVDSATLWSGEYTEEIWGIIKSEKCNAANFTAKFLSDLVSFTTKYKDPYKLDIVMAGGQIIDSYFCQVVGLFCRRLQVGYGMAETGLISSTDPLTSAEHLETGNVGKARSDKEIKIVDTNGGTTERGVPGEICVRSYFMFRGYIMSQNDGPEDCIITNSWFKTGDVGYITDKGELVICGRTKEIIMRGTDHIFPGAFEGMVMKMEGIKSVVVIPVPDRRMYQEICVCYIPNDDSDIQPEHVREFCRNKTLRNRISQDHGEIPRYYLLFEEFPLLPSRKPNKHDIKAIAINKLGLSMDSQVNKTS